jgi:hypothetical protein
MTGYYRFGGEFGVNRATASDQTAPSIATFADGSFVIVWGTSDPAQDGDTSAIKGQLFDSAGNKVGAEFLVNSNHAGYQFTASVAALSDGSFVVTWVTTDPTQDGDQYAIKGQIYAHDGTSLGGEFLVNAGAPAGSQFTPNVAALTSGGFVVSWDDSTLGDVKAQIFSATGGRQGAVFTVNTNTLAAQEYGDITALAGGGFVATWRTTDPSADGSDQAVKAQIFNDQGRRVGNEFLVNTAAYGAQYDPSIAALSTGGFVVTWMTLDTGQDGSGSAIKGQLFSATGAKVGREFLVNSIGYDSQREAVVTALPGGGFLVAWSTWDTLQDGSSSAIKAQVFDAAGAKVGYEFRVNTLTSGAQFLPDAATLPDGRVLLTWASESGDGSGYAVRAQFLGPNQAPVIVSDGGGTDAALSVAENGTSVTVVRATDDGNPFGLHYFIVGGADAALFKIDAVSGAVSFVSAPNFEAPADAGRDNVYDVVVRASDTDLFDDQHLAVRVTNVNEGLSIQSKPTQPMVENQVLVTYIGAVDQDGDPVAYSIVGGADGALFTIDRFMGGLKFITAPDFEAPADANHDNGYEVLIRATDGQFVDDKLITVTVGNVNEGLSIVSPASVSVAENGSAVATVIAHDIDGDAPRYSIVGGADAALFVIDPQSGALRFASAPDFEAPRDAGGDNIYDVVVRATDGQFVDDQHLAVTVTNLNEGVFVTSAASLSVPENGNPIGTVTAFDPDGTPTVYSIVGGADAASFSIDAATGALSFVSAPDFEAPADAGHDNVYDVIVRASDGELSDDRALTVTVGNVNEGLSIVSPASVSVAENGSAVATVIAHDIDGDAPGYSIVGGADAALFVVDPQSGALRFASAPDFEAPRDAGGDNIYDVVVRATDGQFVDDQHLAVTVTNVNEGVAITSPASLSVLEGGTAAWTVTAFDPDGTPTVYSIVGGADAASFTIDAANGALRFIAAPDFEAPADSGHDNVYDVTVRASDGELFDDRALTVTVGNVNEPLSITSAPAVSVRENGTFVTSVSASDIDGDAPVYSIAGGADAALFVIDAATGALSFRSAPDFEAPADAGHDNVYDVVIRASDGQFSDAQHLSVAVGNVNEGIAITSSAYFSVLENGTAAGAVAAFDPDGTASTYAIVGGADAALFAIDAATGALSFRSAPDFETPRDAGGDNVYEVLVQASDGELSARQLVSVTVGNVNEGVTIAAPSAVSVRENTAAVTNVAGVDADGGPVAYSISGGADAALFSIDAATGALRFVSAPDFERPGDRGGDNVYDLIVSATDGTFTASQAIAVAVGNVDEPAAFGAASAAFAVQENGTGVGLVHADDPDGGRVTYAIAGGADAVLFTIDPATGALSFRAAPDFEAPRDAGANDVYDLIVSASDGNSTATQAVTVTVGNAEEPVAFGASSKSFSVAENGAAVGAVLAVDPDGGRVVYGLVGGADAALFTIDAATGALSFRSAPDYETARDADHDNVYSVTVSASDGASSAIQAVSVSVTNVDEAVGLVSYSGAASVALTVPENGRAVGTVAAADPDGDRVSYTIGGGADAAWFTVDAATGALSFVTPPDFEAKADAGHDNVYDVTVIASTATSSAAQAFAVTVSNVDEPVAIASLGGRDAAAVSVAENGRLVGTVSAVDPDGGAVTYSIAGGADAARFTIDAKTGVLQFVTAPDYEAPNDAGGDHVYDVTVKASDGTTSDVQAISVTILNVQDGVTIMGSNGSDAINGTSANPALRTTAAEDTVFGGDGNDTIQGLGGDDNLNGDAGKDVLTGGAGADRLIGGAGADQFVYNAVSESTPTVRDLITDFSHAQGDKIVLTGIDANTLVAGDQAFTFIGSAAFSHAAGQLRFESDGHGNTILSGDVNGDGIADFQVQLAGTITLVSSDFLL